MMSAKTRQLALLIRAQENEDGSRWRAMVEHVYTGQKVRFSERSGLMDYLKAHFSEDSEKPLQHDARGNSSVETR